MQSLLWLWDTGWWFAEVLQATAGEEVQGNSPVSCPYWFWQNVLEGNLLCWWWDHLESFSLRCQPDWLGYCAWGCYWEDWSSRPTKLEGVGTNLRFSTESQVGSHKPTDDPDVSVSWQSTSYLGRCMSIELEQKITVLVGWKETHWSSDLPDD